MVNKNNNIYKDTARRLVSGFIFFAILTEKCNLKFQKPVDFVDFVDRLVLYWKSMLYFIYISKTIVDFVDFLKISTTIYSHLQADFRGNILIIIIALQNRQIYNKIIASLNFFFRLYFK